MNFAEQFTGLERGLIERLQVEFPLDRTPYAVLAEELNVSEASVVGALRQMRASGLLRRISAVIEAKRLGFSSALIGAAVQPQAIENVARRINRHPGVSHNYQRQGTFNLWFTLLTPPNGKLSFDDTVRILTDRPEISAAAVFFAVKTYKLRVRLPVKTTFDPMRWSAPSPCAEEQTGEGSFAKNEMSPTDQALIAALQQDLPADLRPFENIAARLNLSFDDLKKATERLRQAKILRRFAGSFSHHRLGFPSGLMVAWRVETERADASGRLLAGYDAVSHCYLRTTHENWPFGLYTMIHGRTDADCQTTLEDMRRRSKLDFHCALSSVREFKKTRVELFSPAFTDWEAEEGGIHTT